MSIVVQKYGGSSVATVEKIGLVADSVVRAKRRGDDVVVVVSAMGKATDELIALAKKMSAEPPRRELDMLVSTGERVTMALLSIAISARGERAISFTGSQSGIMTNDRHFDARIIEVRPFRIEDELARGKVVIVAGYQGMSYRREITTLGRGGSDTTAVALAAALGAARCEIYSDVDGVYSADPRVVGEAEHLPALNLETLQEMAEAGAKVLNAQAVEWARRSGITLFARKTGDPVNDAGEPARQTEATEAIEVPAAGSPHESRARAVVGLAGVARVACPPSQWRQVTGVLGEAHCRLLDARSEATGARALLSLANVPDWGDVVARLRACSAEAVVTEGLALVSVVGSGLGTVERTETFLRVLRAAGIVPQEWFASELRISALVDAGRCEEAQRVLHPAFVRV